MAQVQKERSKRETEEIEPLETPAKAEFDIDELLDEIDDVLEENAEAFVQSYVQRGGELWRVSQNTFMLRPT
jgi:ubiquitin-like protein Pup